MRRLTHILAATLLLGSIGCASKSLEVLNPLGDTPSPDVGERSNKLLLDESNAANSKADEARHALEVMGSYRRAQAPQPVYPVVQPAEVRLMWIPDHLNKSGDLVPAHYYYLRVLNDRWAVQDAFDLEQQLHDGTDAGGGSATPYIIRKGKKSQGK